MSTAKISSEKLNLDKRKYDAHSELRSVYTTRLPNNYYWLLHENTVIKVFRGEFTLCTSNHTLSFTLAVFFRKQQEKRSSKIAFIDLMCYEVYDRLIFPPKKTLKLNLRDYFYSQSTLNNTLWVIYKETLGFLS